MAFDDGDSEDFMSVIIKGMKIPEDCFSCPLKEEGFCNITNAYAGQIYKRNSDCPLVELPGHHGRLVDADELKTAFPRCDNNMDIKIASVRATINHMPTIVEAE